jgi:hypothetical protein
MNIMDHGRIVKISESKLERRRSGRPRQKVGRC